MSIEYMRQEPPDPPEIAMWRRRLEEARSKVPAQLSLFA